MIPLNLFHMCHFITESVFITERLSRRKVFLPCHSSDSGRVAVRLSPEGSLNDGRVSEYCIDDHLGLGVSAYASRTVDFELDSQLGQVNVSFRSGCISDA